MEICEAEAELGIAFPDQYREYLLRQDTGGAVNRLCRSTAGWGWHGDLDTNYDLLTTAFPHPDSYRAYEDELEAREPLTENFPATTPTRQRVSSGTPNTRCSRSARRPALYSSKTTAAASRPCSSSPVRATAHCGSTAGPPATRSCP
ncbi:SMI1/KNR4 family protein [Streptomyces clavifer]|uniref:SMI1/KNR4 family protein n=1 Tax=Streptomyces clavifer TaxID=68188 RepID=UPI0036A28E49